MAGLVGDVTLTAEPIGEHAVIIMAIATVIEGVITMVTEEVIWLDIKMLKSSIETITFIRVSGE
jgi:hypothetical protein